VLSSEGFFGPSLIKDFLVLFPFPSSYYRSCYYFLFKPVLGIVLFVRFFAPIKAKMIIIRAFMCSDAFTTWWVWVFGDV